MKILDCTLRDGGYYTNWDFCDNLVDLYGKTMESLPVDIIEVGYHSVPLMGYHGKYYYCPTSVLEQLKSLMPTKSLAVILNEKHIKVSDIKGGLLQKSKPYVDLVRIAVSPENIITGIELAKSIKDEGFEVALNIMYASNWRNIPAFFDVFSKINNSVDIIYIVDSFGSMTPQSVKDTIKSIQEKSQIKLGFHGHNNLELALINSLTAYENGCEIIDSTITGMGRGAGNLKTELLLTYLESLNHLDFSYTQLSHVVGGFEDLRQEFKWGTGLPYMFSGAMSLPQKQVMEWISQNRYPLDSMMTALNNQKNDLKDNIKLPTLVKENKYTKAVIVGGGHSVTHHEEAIKVLLRKDTAGTCLIHAGVKHIKPFLKIENDQYYCFSGFESDKLKKNIGDLSVILNPCIYPPFPRIMGTTISEELKNQSFELEEICFTKKIDSPLAIAIQIALDKGVKEISLVGFDGYDTDREKYNGIMAQENQDIIDSLSGLGPLKYTSLTPTRYKNLNIKSIYSLL